MINYEKNYNLIKVKYPYLIKELNGTAANNDLKLETSHSRRGMPVLRVTRKERRIFLNSPYDPVLEAERWAERRGGNAKGALILCGGGFLYHLRALIKQGHYQKVVCYEPSPAILKDCLHEIDLTEIKGDYLLLTGNNYDECVNLIGEYLMYMMLDSDWAVLPAYQELFPEEIGAFEKVLRESVRVSRANLATANLFGEKWASNAVKNLPVIIKSPGIKHFFNQFNGIPAVIISAGPSLEKNIHLLNEIKEKAVLICAGTSIRAMLKYGIKPHFLVAFDGTDYNKTIYSELDLDDICLIYNYRFNHEALSFFGGKKVYMKLDTETFSDFLSLKCGYEFGTVRSGFSVAHPSLDIAIKFGCSPVILIGQDLAYTGDKRYAESQYQQVLDRRKLPANCFITKDLYGQDVVTDKQLDSFRLLFEMMVSEYYQGKKIFNATEGGQPIKGIPNYKLADLIREFCRKERGIGRKVEEIYDSGLKAIQQHSSRVINLVGEIRTMAELGVFKMENLLDRVRQLKYENFAEGSLQEGPDKALEEVAAEYRGLIKARDWRLLMKDLQDWKIAPNQIALTNLGKGGTEAGFNAKLQYWTNIIAETKKYLEYLIEQLAAIEAQEEFSRGSQVLSLVQIADTKTPEQFGEWLNQGGRLTEIKAELEKVINLGNRKDLNEYLYWYGIVLFKTKDFAKAAIMLEKAYRHNRDDAKVSFLLYRCSRKLGNYTKAQEYLGNCLRLGFKADFCRRTLVKNAYRYKDYVSAHNFIIDFQASLGEEYLYQCLRVDCLFQLQLSGEARAECQGLALKSGMGKGLWERLQRLTDETGESEYEKNYRLNEVYFKEKGITPGTYKELSLKYCSYLGKEYIYDTGSKQILVAERDRQTDKLEILTSDTLLICDTDDPHVYLQLKSLLREAPAGMKQTLIYLPILIIERQLANWQLMMQKFNFNELAELKNIHFFIGVSDEDLAQLFSDNAVPLPNVLYGTGLDEIKQLLAKVKDVKEKEYQRLAAALREYYHQAKPERFNKVLIVTSIKEESLFEYGKTLQSYLKEQGLETILDYEKPPYYTFNKYADLNLLERFRPDLVIHLFAVAEELEAYQGLDLPFVSWRISGRWLTPDVVADYSRQKLLVNGESKLNAGLDERGFQPGQIKSVVLPYAASAVGAGFGEVRNDAIVIVKDLNDHEGILERLIGAVMGMLTAERGFTGEEIIAICRAIFFKLITGLQNQSSLTPSNQFYREIVAEEFQRRGRVLAVEKVQTIAGLFQRELEDSLLTLIQAKWLVNQSSNFRLKLYGSGWENDLNLKNFQEAPLKLFSEAYRRVILQSKIMLYSSLMIKNGSYMQPDLINGIAGGGFFLVNGCLVDTVGEKVLEPFAGLLETYRNREELLEKTAYFLKNETERREKAGRLQEHILRNFGIDRVAKVIFEAYREIV